MSASWIKEVALTFTDAEGMLFEIGECFREDAICCDVSWISKYNMNECEILIARSVDATMNEFECKIIDHLNGIQIVSLQPYGYHQKTLEKKLNKMNDSLAEEKKDEEYDDSKAESKSQDSFHSIKLHDMEVVDQRHKNLVYGYTRQVQRIIGCRLPLDVFLICFSYYYEGAERAKVSCYAKVYRVYNKQWVITNGGAWCEVHLYEDHLGGWYKYHILILSNLYDGCCLSFCTIFT